MNEWKSKEKELQELLHTLSKLYLNKNDEELETVGSCIMINIALCQDCDSIQDKNLQTNFWHEIKNDIHDIIIDIQSFIKNKSST